MTRSNDQEREQSGRSIDGRLEEAKTRALGPHRSAPGKGDMAAHAAGGITGAIVGGVIGNLGGPVGLVLGGIAGALGGWWAGRAISEAASALAGSDEAGSSEQLTEQQRDEAEPRERRRNLRHYDEEVDVSRLGRIAAENPNLGDARSAPRDASRDRELPRGTDEVRP